MTEIKLEDGDIASIRLNKTKTVATNILQF